ncbi:PREDICTED: uncharacterized protein LOC106807247 [Priapulus caudatus]|uniref:Uncharacterized protein LOC106807247 n=1 Tax=Priapulus caudatus TaxID=37621 RepID=A0ABM1DYK3_PRICU|nr:PREDICTED: uncharacterized protein LOC106807247 [Priapulus caudatus]
MMTETQNAHVYRINVYHNNDYSDSSGGGSDDAYDDDGPLLNGGVRVVQKRPTIAAYTNGHSANHINNNHAASHITNGNPGCHLTNGIAGSTLSNGHAGSHITNGNAGCHGSNGHSGFHISNGHSIHISNGHSGSHLSNGHSVHLSNGHGHVNNGYSRDFDDVDDGNYSSSSGGYGHHAAAADTYGNGHLPSAAPYGEYSNGGGVHCHTSASEHVTTADVSQTNGHANGFTNNNYDDVFDSEYINRKSMIIEGKSRETETEEEERKDDDDEEEERKEGVSGKGIDLYPMKFHLNELASVKLNGVAAERDHKGASFTGRSLIDGRYHSNVAITSATGSVRGVRNRVRAGIETFKNRGQQDGTKKNYEELEKNKVVIYTTSLRVVRSTFDNCEKTRNIFRTLMVRFDERDLCVNEEAQEELRERQEVETLPEIPQVFLNGELIGGADTVEQLNESGFLRQMLKDFKKVIATTSCEQCGGFAFLPCHACSGSKKSMHRNHFTEEFHALRCTMCDDNGLVRCVTCNAAH